MTQCHAISLFSVNSDVAQTWILLQPLCVLQFSTNLGGIPMGDLSIAEFLIHTHGQNWIYRLNCYTAQFWLLEKEFVSDSPQIKKGRLHNWSISLCRRGQSPAFVASEHQHQASGEADGALI